MISLAQIEEKHLHRPEIGLKFQIVGDPEGMWDTHKKKWLRVQVLWGEVVKTVLQRRWQSQAHRQKHIPMLLKRVGNPSCSASWSYPWGASSREKGTWISGRFRSCANSPALWHDLGAHQYCLGNEYKLPFEVLDWVLEGQGNTDAKPADVGRWNPERRGEKREREKERDGGIFHLNEPTNHQS